jgi:hypothetical protein
MSAVQIATIVAALALLTFLIVMAMPKKSEDYTMPKKATLDLKLLKPGFMYDPLGRIVPIKKQSTGQQR